MPIGFRKVVHRYSSLFNLQQCRNVQHDRSQREYRKFLQKNKINKSLEADEIINLKNRGKKVNFEETAYSGSTALGDKKDVSIPLPRTYSPKFVESHWYEWWEKKGFLSCKSTPEAGKKKFSMVIPPPNVTGELHLGHAFTATVQDVLVRWNKMQGNDVVWVPGMDHAGIATQVIVERQITLESGETRYDLGRDKFNEAVWKWKNSKGGKIAKQLRRMGAMLDWNKDIFTMNPEYSYAVREAFIRLFEEGLIYREKKLVNWCETLQTTISDIEVENKIINEPENLNIHGYDFPVVFGMLHKFAYKLADPTENDKEVVVATTRLETILGDTAVAVHPDDPRYAHLIGKRLEMPFTNGGTIPIIADTAVDMNMGTGAVKITPAHDFTDFEIGKRHSLPMPCIIKKDGCMDLSEVNISAISTTNIEGEHKMKARKLVLIHLNKMGLYRGCNPHPMILRLCSRSGDVLEPSLQSQWFVRVKDMAEAAKEAISSGTIELQDAQKYAKQWEQWLTRSEDWCISRQVWWGHQIPAYYCSNKTGEEKWVVAHTEEEARSKAQALFPQSQPSQISIKQDDDVLDTWFSSALFPFAAFGWPKQTQELKRFYPLSLMETGQDLIFFWVARMVMLGLKLTEQNPFEKIMFHGMVRDSYGRKMSKSLGNVINPMQVIHGATVEERLEDVKKMGLTAEENRLSLNAIAKQKHKDIPQCGADALRMSLCMHSTNAQSIKYDLDSSIQARQICNKILNAFYLVNCVTRKLADLMDQGSDKVNLNEVNENWSAFDHLLNKQLLSTVDLCNTLLQQNMVHRAYVTVIEFFRQNFCDEYLEASKALLSPLQVNQFYNVGRTQMEIAMQVHLVRAMEIILRLIAPFAPFLAEELWQRIPKKLVDQPNWESICIASFPNSDNLNLPSDVNQVKHAEMVFHTSRRIADNYLRFPMFKKDAVTLLMCDDPKEHALLSANQEPLTRLAQINNLSVIQRDEIGGYKDKTYGLIHNQNSVHVLFYPKNANLPDYIEDIRQTESEKLESFHDLLSKTKDDIKMQKLKKRVEMSNKLLEILEKTRY